MFLRTLQKPIEFDLTKGFLIIAFTMSDQWIRLAHNLYVFLSELWSLVGERCESKQTIPAIFDMVFLHKLSWRKQVRYGHTVDHEKTFHTFLSVYQLTKIMDLEEYKDVLPATFYQYAIKYKCIDNKICMFEHTENSKDIIQS